MIPKQFRTPDTLLKWAQSWQNKHQFEFYPQPTNEPLKQVCQDLYQQAQKIKQHWQKYKDDCLAQINHSDVNKRQYSKRNLTIWTQQMNAWAHQTDVAQANVLIHFSQAKLNQSTKTPTKTPTHTVFELIDQYLKKLNRVFDVWEIDCIKKVRQETRATPQQTQINFDDLLTLCHDALIQNKTLCQRICMAYPVALIDEFQDTDPTQYAIFKQIYSNNKSCLWFIGDPKQAIYSFRGADLNTYLRAKKETDQCFSLNKNWRASKVLIDALNHFYQSFKNPFVALNQNIQFETIEYGDQIKDKSLTYQAQVVTPIQLICSNDFTENTLTSEEYKSQAAIHSARHIIKLTTENYLINQKPIVYDDICLLVRSKSDINIVTQALEEI